MPSFPDGPVGVGLAVLRTVLAAELLSTALDVVTSSSPTMTSMAVAVALGVLSIAMLGGLWTAVAAGVTVLGVSLAAAIGARLAFTTDVPLHVVGYATALWLTGPGAYAIDARRHGRREIVVPRRPSGPS